MLKGIPIIIIPSVNGSFCTKFIGEKWSVINPFIHGHAIQGYPNAIMTLKSTFKVKIFTLKNIFKKAEIWLILPQMSNNISCYKYMHALYIFGSYL